MDEAIKTLAAWLQESKKAVFFGGAGVSTASGIPDFRSTDGLYNQQYAWPPETILSHTFLKKSQRSFIDFIRIKCCVWRRSQTPAIFVWRSWSRRGICAQW